MAALEKFAFVNSKHIVDLEAYSDVLKSWYEETKVVPSNGSTTTASLAGEGSFKRRKVHKPIL